MTIAGTIKVGVKVAGIASVFLVAGCMSTPNSSPDFGQSVDYMVGQQVYDPGAAAVPPEESIKPVDGGAVERVITGYRESALTEGDTIQNEIQINVGN